MKRYYKTQGCFKNILNKASKYYLMVMVTFHGNLALPYETNKRINISKSKNSKRMNKELLSLASRDKPVLKKKNK